MKSFTEDGRLSAVMLVGLSVLMLVTLFRINAAAGIFGMGEYPGGTLRAVFHISEPSSDAPPREYTIKVEPSGDSYDVTEKVSSPGRAREEVSTAFGASGGASAGGSRYDEGGYPTMDLSPLSTIDERNIEIKPNQPIRLPDGGRLVAQEEDNIAGVDVVTGVFTHSNYPNQRARLALADRETRDLLLFPTFFELLKNGEVETRIELVEFSYQP
ncbi:MAG: hypothetical protein V5A87_00565 [Candidatus Bipolaricaulota bacterium]